MNPSGFLSLENTDVIDVSLSDHMGEKRVETSLSLSRAGDMIPKSES